MEVDTELRNRGRDPTAKTTKRGKEHLERVARAVAEGANLAELMRGVYHGEL